MGVPAPRGLDDDSAMRGAALFERMECTNVIFLK
ncbi:MAG: hypothetical protein KDC64_08985 [Aequorivita sp.]|nr:hypothetical protein [Aequorivita sp.]